jgi:integrase
MAKHTGKLTKTVVDAWAYDDADQLLWDGKLPGFGVKANRDGSKTFLIAYRNKYASKRRYTIGRLGGKLTTDVARAKADALLSRIRLEGFDPMEDKRASKSAMTVNQLLDEYLKSPKFLEKTDHTQASDKSRLKRHVRPLLGSVKVEQVTPDKVRRVFADIRDGKTAAVEKTGPRGKSIVRGGDGVARMCIRNVRAIFNWAISEGLLTANPAEKINIGTDGQRDTILETPEQYAALFKALDKLQTERRMPDNAADVIRVLAFTGARLGEVAGMRWHHIDLERGTATLPPKAHKTGHRSGKPKQIALPAGARNVIANRPQGEPNDYVFPPARGDNPITISSNLWKLVRKEAGLPDGINNHALRHSLGTLMAMQGAQAAEIMAALGHSQLSTSQRYIHFAQDARTAMADKYTAGINAAITGKPKAEVVKMKRSAKK